MENLRRTGRPLKSDGRGGRRIVRHKKAHRKQTLAEITNCANDIIIQPVSPRLVRHGLRFCGFTRFKIRKQTVTSRVNRAHREFEFRCRQKLSWKAGDWKSVAFSVETQVVIGGDRSLGYVWRKPHKVWQLGCLVGGNSRKISAM